MGMANPHLKGMTGAEVLNLALSSFEGLKKDGEEEEMSCTPSEMAHGGTAMAEITTSSADSCAQHLCEMTGYGKSDNTVKRHLWQQRRNGSSL